MVNWIWDKIWGYRRKEKPITKSIVIQAMKPTENTGYILDIYSGAMISEAVTQIFNITISFERGTYADIFIKHSKLISQKGLIITNVIKLD